MRHFALTEFDCSHCGKNQMDVVFLEELDELRHRYGKQLIVTSGYRCPAHNAAVSATGHTGPHTTGRAADILVDRRNALDLLKIALSMNFSGFGLKQHGAGRYIHLDTLSNANGQPRPTIWTYP